MTSTSTSTSPTPRSARTMADLSHAELAVVVREHLLAGHLIDRAGMPVVVAHGLEVMRDVAVDEWMGASPVYTKRMQRLLGFEGDTVETVFKGMQIDIGAPPEFMDFRYRVDDATHGEFFLNHCGALMDVEPMGEDFVVAMCHDIEDPTFDATGWASNPRVRMHPTHRPPRVPGDRHPHCAWTVEIAAATDATPMPDQARRVAGTVAAGLPVATIEPARQDDSGLSSYRMPLDPDLRMEDFSRAALVAIDDEVCLQGHLLVLSFLMAVEDRFGTETAVDIGAKQFAGVAGVAAGRLRRALGLGSSTADIATVLALHPAFRPHTYVNLGVELDGDALAIVLEDCPALTEQGRESWITILAEGHARALDAIVMAVDPRASCQPDGDRRWRVVVGGDERPELDEVTLTRFSTGADFEFRPAAGGPGRTPR